MALFGSFGKALGLGSAGEVAGDVAGFLGFNPAAQKAISSGAQAASEAISSIGEDRPDVATSPQQAGVDSAATILNVSQTGQLSPGGMGGRLPQTQQAGFGLVGPLSQLLGQGARQLSRPGVGGLIGGTGAGLIADFVMDSSGNTKKLVITRKLQRETKKLFMMSGGDLGIVSANSLSFLGKDLSPQQVLMVLFKTFKNQGPYVTKAAVRKTRQTIRKLDTLEMLKAQMCPPKRAPARRRTMGSTTKVLQVK
jgi:hypothetical protein